MAKGVQCRRVLHYFYHRFFDDHILRTAASLSYSTLLSIVPFMIMSVFVLSWVPHFRTMGPLIQQFILNNFVVSSANLDHQLARFVSKIVVLKWTNMVALSITSMLLMVNMVDAFNDVWKVSYRYHFAWTLLIYWCAVLLMPIAFACVLFVGPYLFSLKFFMGSQFFHSMTRFMMKFIPFIASFFVFTLCNWLLPSTSVKLRYASVAGLVSAIGFSLAKYGFSFYLHFFKSYQLIYGALAAIPFFLVWVYIAWIIVLVGAQICHTLSTGIDGHAKQ